MPFRLHQTVFQGEPCSAAKKYEDPIFFSTLVLTVLKD